MASSATPPRRIHRSEKLCAFQVKNATGWTAPRLSRLPSTRQKVALGVLDDDVKSDIGAVVAVCDPVLFLLSTALTTELSSLRNFIDFLFGGDNAFLLNPVLNQTRRLYIAARERLRG